MKQKVRKKSSVKEMGKNRRKYIQNCSLDAIPSWEVADSRSGLQDIYCDLWNQKFC
jgi:hypothetical protein